MNTLSVFAISIGVTLLLGYPFLVWWVGRGGR